jgi:alpha-ribazole phosphatase
MTDTLLDVMRHGEPEGGRRYRGHRIDDPLSANGLEQMWTALDGQSPWQRIISSPLQRCSLFARQLSSRYALPLTLEDNFREVGFGAWEGLTPDEVARRHARDYRDFYIDPLNNRPAGAEPLPDFSQRVITGLERQLQRYPGEHLLIIAHAGVIRAMLGHVVQASPVGWYRCRIDPAGISRFRCGEQGLKLEFHNRPSLARP